MVDLRQNDESFVPAETEFLIKEALKTDLGLAMLGNAAELVKDYFKNRPDKPKYEANKQMADTYIHPNLAGYNALSFGESNIKAMVEIGKTVAESKLVIPSK